MRSNISLMLHYVTDEFEIKCWALEVQHFPGKHDAPAIAATLSAVLARWGLCREQCTKLLRDGAANAVAASDLLGVDQMSCIAHSIHLVVGGALFKKKNRSGAPGALGSQSTTTIHEEVGSSSAVSELCSSAEVDEDDGAILNDEEQAALTRLQELAVDEMDAFASLHPRQMQVSPLDSIQNPVQVFRSLATYFRRAPKGITAST